LPVDILEGSFSHLFFSFQFSQKVSNFLLLFKVSGVIVNSCSSDLLSFVFFLFEVIFVFVVFLASILFSPHTSLSLLVDFVSNVVKIALPSVLLEGFIFLQESGAVFLDSIKLFI
jgi:hypothetical protein